MSWAGWRSELPARFNWLGNLNFDPDPNTYLQGFFCCSLRTRRDLLRYPFIWDKEKLRLVRTNSNAERVNSASETELSSRLNITKSLPGDDCALLVVNSGKHPNRVLSVTARPQIWPKSPNNSSRAWAAATKAPCPSPPTLSVRQNSPIIRFAI